MELVEHIIVFRRQLGEHFGRSIGDGAADGPECLEGFGGIDKYGTLRFQRLTCFGKGFCGRACQAQFAVFGAGVHFHIGGFPCL